MTLKWHGYAALALAIVAGASPVHGQKMYWTDNGGIKRANLDGSDTEVIVADVTSLGIAIDFVRKKVYWTDLLARSIHRANLDGSQNESLITTGLFSPRGIALDLARGKMYWANWSPARIQRANLDGTGVEDVVLPGLRPTAIRLDAEAGKVYWANFDTPRIQRANLDGTEVEDVIAQAGLPVFSMALDLDERKIYYTQAELGFIGFLVPGFIHRANLDGSGVEELVVLQNLSAPFGIALDVTAGKMYWALTGTGRIQRANLDGSDVETLVSGLRFPSDLALELPGQKIPAIPTVSVWGLVLMALLLLTMARVSWLRRLLAVR